MDTVLITIFGSAALGSLTLFLVWINWKILRISKDILEVSRGLLEETIIIRVETIRIRDISLDIYYESVKLRKNTEMPDPAPTTIT